MVCNYAYICTDFDRSQANISVKFVNLDGYDHPRSKRRMMRCAYEYFQTNRCKYDSMLQAEKASTFIGSQWEFGRPIPGLEIPLVRDNWICH